MAKPKAGAVAALVEARATLEHARPLGGRNSCAVILDDDRRPGAGADADALRGMARGILKQVAEHLGEVGAVERHLHVVGNVRLEGHAHAGRRARQRRDQRAHERRQRGGMAVPVPDRAAHPGPRQFAVDMAAHGIADRLDVLRDGLFATVAQAGGIGRKRRQRRLEPVGEIGRPAARALDLLFLRVEQRVDLLDQRPHLGRHLGRQMLAAPGSDLGDTAAQRVERAQAEANLNRGGNRQHQTQQAERDGEVLGEGRGGRRHAGQIGGDGDAHRHAPIADREKDAPLGDQHMGIGGTHDLVMMKLARRQLVGRQPQCRIPQRARAQQLAAIVRHLPVKSRQRIGKARIGGRPGHDQIALRIDIDAGEQLLEMNVEIVGHGAGDVTLEQQDQPGAGNRQRHQDRDDPAGDQPQPQRSQSHAGVSGTM